MKTQISRKTFDEEKRYSGIYQQMGRMLTDADWNELSDMEKNRLAEALTDVIGSGTPRQRGIVESITNPDDSVTHILKWGYAYVDGVSAQVRPASDAVLADPNGEMFEYEHQADFPDAPAPVGDHILYLDVWERTVTALEDGDIRDSGLHGADTCTRTQTMAQVKWCSVGVDPEDETQNPTKGQASLSLAIRTGSTEPDPCDPCAEDIALQDKVGNYLFRMEIHDVVYDGAGNPERVTLKWSSENGSEQYVVGEAPPGFESDNWAYEFFSGSGQAFASEKHLGRHLATGFLPSRGELNQAYPDPVPAGFDLVRRWDGFCVLEKNGSDWDLLEGHDRGVGLANTIAASAHGHVTNGATLTINLDAITVNIELADLALLAGDFWLSEVRQAIHVAGSVLMTNELVCGIKHHYMTLGAMIGGVFEIYDAQECKRFEFPPLTDMDAKSVCYNNDACNMPLVDNVQQAIDYLCQQRDLRWHHKHLHGWGIVCGLIAECCPEHAGEPPIDGEPTEPGDDVPPGQDDGDRTRRTVCVTPGHAITCEGDTLSLGEGLTIDVMEQIEALQEAGQEILTEGAGSVCLRMDPGPDGQPQFNVEPYDSDAHADSMFDGTLLMDFYQHCVVDLVDSLRSEFGFMDQDELDEVEGGSTGLVSADRRKFISFVNLIIQLANSGNGSYVFLSRKEHLVLRDIYLQLRGLLRSKTFCAMFQDNEFPDYPFNDIGMTTYFGKNTHTRAQVNPEGDRIYTYGGTNNTINVYDTGTEELVEVLEMPSAEGAEVSAIAFTPDGSLMFVAASVREIDTEFAIVRVGREHVWEDMTILCGLKITEMAVSPQDEGLVYALGVDRGLYFLRPDLFIDEADPQPAPAYAFNAAGHMVLDLEQNMAYCTAQSSPDITGDVYDQVSACDLNTSEENQSPTHTLSLIGPNGNILSGSDGLALRPGGGRSGRLYVVAENNDDTKQVLTYATPIEQVQEPLAALPVENTDISLAFHREQDRLLLAMEDGYRIQVVDANGQETLVTRVPVQIQPVDIIVNQNDGNIYAVNFLSNTVSVIPANELNVATEFLNTLASYRTEILTAFYGLFGGLLQYLKDCFCHHLLVKCPTCDDQDVLYLATVEIRDNEVYKICNFDKRKYVKSFPTMGYWFSLIPVWPLIKTAVSQVCCSILPDIFSDNQDTIIRQPEPVEPGQTTVQSNFVRADTARVGVQTYQRTDPGQIFRTQTKGIRLNTSLMTDSATNIVASSRTATPGVNKQTLLKSNTSDAVATLQRNQIAVTDVVQYDPAQASNYRKEFNSTPQKINPGSEVTLVEKEGQVVYYTLRQPQATITEVPENIRDEIQQLETQKAALADFSEVSSELDTLRADLANLQTERANAETELATLQSQVDAIQGVRAAEEVRLADINSQRDTIAADLDNLSASLSRLSALRQEVSLEVERGRPVSDIAEVSAEVDGELRELGIRTVDELSGADASRLSASGRIDPSTAETIIGEATRRINRE